MKVSLIIFALSLFLWNSSAQDKSAQIDSLMQWSHDQLHFDGSILVAENGNVIYRKAFGLANRELNIENTVDAKFRIGSISKQFCAMLVMQLVEKGILDLDKNIKFYIKDYPEIPGAKIKIRNLLTHTSGLPDIYDIPGFDDKKNYSADTIFRMISNRKLNFEPGERFEYSNSNFMALGYLLVKVTGKSADELLKEHILDPLGMSASGLDHNGLTLDNRANPYIFDKGTAELAEYIDMETPGLAGGMYSTIDDLFRWDQALYTNKLVSYDMLNRIFSPYKLNSGELTRYGFGWRINNNIVWHSGHINGFLNIIVRDTLKRNCIIILSNDNFLDLGRVCRRLIRILNSNPYSLPEARNSVSSSGESFSGLEGKYADGEDTLQVVIKGQDLYLEVGGAEIKLLPYSNNEFYIDNDEADIVFEKDDEGNISRILSMGYISVDRAGNRIK